MTNHAPNAPTLVLPAIGGGVNPEVVNRFTWVFSDPDTSDHQSKADLAWRVVGSELWTILSGTTTVPRCDIAAGTFTDGESYEWKVRCYDAAGLAGDWSSSGFFEAHYPPDTPIITDPTTDQDIVGDNYTVYWTAPDQEAFQVRRVANSSGSPNTSVVYQDSGTVTSTSRYYDALTFTVNNRTEHVQVRVRYNGVWGDWGSVRVNIAKTPPPTPIAAVTPDNTKGCISVSAVHPRDLGGVVAVSMDILRSEAGATAFRIAKDLDPDDSYDDYFVKSGVEYQYIVRAKAASGAYADSSGTEVTFNWSTNGLIGFWPLDETSGAVAHDTFERYDMDVVGNPEWTGGLLTLAENRLLHSAGFDNAIWHETGGTMTVTPNAAANPQNGTVDADLLSNAHVSNACYVTQEAEAVECLTGDSVTWAIRLKQVTGPAATIEWGGASEVTGGTESLESLGNGWYIHTVTGIAANDNPVAIVQILARPSSSVYAYGAQLNRGESRCDLWPTTSAVVQGSANTDDIPMTLDDDWSIDFVLKAVGSRGTLVFLGADDPNHFFAVEYNGTYPGVARLRGRAEPRNKVLYSSQFERDVWWPQKTSIETDRKPDPILGEYTADYFTCDDTAAAQHLIYQNLGGVTVGDPIVFSIYVEPETISQISIGCTGGANDRADFNLTGAGSVLSTGANLTSAAIAKVGDFYRCSVADPSISTARLYVLLCKGGMTTFDGVYRTGTAQAGGANTITLDAGASAVNGFYVPGRVTITAGTGAGQCLGASAYDGTSKVLTLVTNWTTPPDGTSEFKIEEGLYVWGAAAHAGSVLAAYAPTTDVAAAYTGELFVPSDGTPVLCRFKRTGWGITLSRLDTGAYGTVAGAGPVGTAQLAIGRRLSSTPVDNVDFAKIAGVSLYNEAPTVGEDAQNQAAWVAALAGRSTPIVVSTYQGAFLPYGDSKTQGAGDETGDAGYPKLLAGMVGGWKEATRIARGGNTVADMQALIDADLAARSDDVDVVLFNLGTNETGAGLPRLVEATWKANVMYILDAMRAKWPTVQVYLARIWRPDENGDLTLIDEDWIPDLVAAYSWVHFGQDERDYLPGTGNCYMYDTYHPNHDGYIQAALAWKAALGW